MFFIHHRETLSPHDESTESWILHNSTRYVGIRNCMDVRNWTESVIHNSESHVPMKWKTAEANLSRVLSHERQTCQHVSKEGKRGISGGTEGRSRCSDNERQPLRINEKIRTIDKNRKICVGQNHFVGSRITRSQLRKPRRVESHWQCNTDVQKNLPYHNTALVHISTL